MTDERVVQAIALAEQLKDYLEWTGWHGTSPEPAVYQPTTSSDRPLDARNTVVQIIAAALAARERAVWEQIINQYSSTYDTFIEKDKLLAWCRQNAEAVKP